MRSKTMLLGSVLTACSVGSVAAPVSPPPPQTFSMGDSGAMARNDSGVSTLPLNKCTQGDLDAHAQSAPGAARSITFPTVVDDVYTPSCMTIKVGQSVAFSSPDGNGQAFLLHPLFPYGGDVDTPITRTDGGDSKTFTFPKAGLFGFACEMHTITMQGAILVVP